MTTQRFQAAIEQTGSKVFITLPFDPNAVWGEKQRHVVSGTINERAIRGSLELNGDTYFISLGPAWRRDNPLNVGKVVEVVLTPEGPQVEGLAPDIIAALNAEPEAKAFFDSLATFYRKNYIRWIEGAKRPETRAARIEETVRLLKEGKKEK